MSACDANDAFKKLDMLEHTAEYSHYRDAADFAAALERGNESVVTGERDVDRLRAPTAVIHVPDRGQLLVGQDRMIDQ